MGSPSPARLFVEAGLERAELLAFAGGDAAVFSAQSPAKQSPNEDAAALIPCGPRAGILVVADGVGGGRNGALAARLAIEGIRTAIPAEPAPPPGLRAAVLDGIERANRRILELGTGAATTLAVVKFEGRSVRPFHVGDSAILVVGQRGRIKHQSLDHGPVGYAVEAGLLDESEALHHEARHVVSNVVGSPHMRIEIGPSIQLAPRDTVLVASDGLSDNLYVEEIVERIRRGPLPSAAETLVADCRRRMTAPEPGKPSKADDLTFILFRPRGRS